MRTCIAKFFTNGRTRVLLENTPCSQAQKFCAAGGNSSLVTKVPLKRLSRGKLGQSVTVVKQFVILFRYPRTLLLLRNTFQNDTHIINICILVGITSSFSGQTFSRTVYSQTVAFMLWCHVDNI
jgi:hypothetical protein